MTQMTTDNTGKIVENYVKICEFLLARAATAPVGTHMDIRLTCYVGHYVTVEIEHKSNRNKAYLRVYDCPDSRSHSPQNYFYVGDDIKQIRATICKDRPTLDLMKNIVIGWHRYGIKEFILNAFNEAVAEANEKIEAEKEIDKFVV